MNKEKISPFEFAIMSIADPEKAKNYQPYTVEEIEQKHKDEIRRFIEKIRIKN